MTNSLQIEPSLLAAARTSKVVVFAGAGVSVGKPSSLPGWKATDAAILRVLVERLERGLDRPGWLTELIDITDAARCRGDFPPDYQAQLIEEMCGERYFNALQALDVDVVNSGHICIAALAAAGALSAVVTTNFDRLIEQALDAHGVRYDVALDEVGFKRAANHLQAGDPTALPVIKIHGSVTRPKSMIDTLKQRKRGRAESVRACIAGLATGYWLYLGFSADDLKTDRDYLGLVSAAAASAGATYVLHPGNADLSPGAKILLRGYGQAGHVVVCDVAPLLSAISEQLGAPKPQPVPDDEAVGRARFDARLQDWAESFSLAEVGLCLAALTEAVGEAEAAARILDQLVRKELVNQRDTPPFQLLQLHYGRLGAALGRFIAVPDMGGAESNISVETTQSLLRVVAVGNQLRFAATTWLTLVLLWHGEGKEAVEQAAALLLSLQADAKTDLTPGSDEEAVDAWLSAAQVAMVAGEPKLAGAALGTAGFVQTAARGSGDVVRQARAKAFEILLLAATGEDPQALFDQSKEVFDDAARVRDGFTLGMLHLALGRWLVGGHRPQVSGSVGPASSSERALALLNIAIDTFHRQGMTPWELYAQIQAMKATANLGGWDEVSRVEYEVGSIVKTRFPILTSHFLEAAGQFLRMRGDERADTAFREACDAAEQTGLQARQQLLRKYVDA